MSPGVRFGLGCSRRGAGVNYPLAILVSAVSQATETSMTFARRLSRVGTVALPNARFDHKGLVTARPPHGLTGDIPNAGSGAGRTSRQSMAHERCFDEEDVRS